MAIKGNSKGAEVRFSASKAQHDYLKHLAETTMLGRTANEVAQHLLAEVLSQKRGDTFDFEVRK